MRSENTPQKKLACYEALKTLTHKSKRQFAVLSGMRRVGKTTILYQLIDHLIDEGVTPQNILYASFEKSKVTNAFLVTKRLGDFGITKHETKTLIFRVPAIAFLYILGKAEAESQNGKL